MSQILQIKKRLKSVQNIFKVTKAMETMAITGLRRIQQQYRVCQEYLEKLEETCLLLGCQTDEEKKIRPCSYILLLSQRGFCGNFNNNLIDFFNKEYQKIRKPEDKIFVLGPLASRFSRRLRKVAIVPVSYENIQELCKEQIAKDREIFLVYNKYISILKQEEKMIKIYPFELSDISQKEKKGQLVYFEPDQEFVKREIRKFYLQALIEVRITESILGEYCNRFHSMKSANDNAAILIDDLKIDLNKTRQSTITAELSEVVSAFEVMRSVINNK